MQSAKETAANIVASAKAGMEKTKATVQEKAEKMTTRDPLQKEMATQKKEERFHEAEREKHETGGGGDYTAGGATATGERHPAVGEGGVLHPHATTTTTGGGSRVGHIDPNAGGGARTGYGSGGTH